MKAEGKIVVERGAQLIVRNNSVITSGCPGERWDGIYVHGNGNPSSSQERQRWVSATQQVWSYDPNGPGLVRIIEGSIIEKAGNGAIRTKKFDDPWNPEYYGGQVVAADAIFRNNIRACEFKKFDNRLGVEEGVLTPELRNYSRFVNCTFEWNKPKKPFETHIYGVSMWEVDDISFTNCEFINNEEPVLDAVVENEKLWLGIKSHDASFTVTGTTFENWNHAISLEDISACLGTIHIGKDDEEVVGQDEVIENGNVFKNNDVAVLARVGERLRITNNLFETDLVTDSGPKVQAGLGVYVEERSDFEIRENEFTNLHTGIRVVNTGGSSMNSISKNTFVGHFFGINCMGTNGEEINDEVDFGGTEIFCSSFMGSGDSRADVHLTEYIGEGSSSIGLLKSIQGTPIEPSDNDWTDYSFCGSGGDSGTDRNFQTRYSVGSFEYVHTKDSYVTANTLPNSLLCYNESKMKPVEIENFELLTNNPCWSTISASNDPSDDPLAGGCFTRDCFDDMGGDIDELDKVLDSGDTDAMLSLLAAAPSHYTTYLELRQKGDKLTEESLEAVVKEESMTQYYRTDILAANSPLEDSLLLLASQKLDDSYYSQLYDLKTAGGLNFRTVLRQLISEEVAKREDIYDFLVSEALKASDYDEVEELVKGMSSSNENEKLFDLYVRTKAFTEAEDQLENHWIDLDPLSKEVQHIVLEFSQSVDDPSLDSEQVSKLYEAANSSGTAARSAKALLSLLYSEEFAALNMSLEEEIGKVGNSGPIYPEPADLLSDYPNLLISPNPVSEDVSLFVSSPIEIAFTVSIVGTDGVSYQEVQYPARTQVVRLSLGQMPAGVYLVEIKELGKASRLICREKLIKI